MAEWQSEDDLMEILDILKHPSPYPPRDQIENRLGLGDDSGYRDKVGGAFATVSESERESLLREAAQLVIRKDEELSDVENEVGDQVESKAKTSWDDFLHDATEANWSERAVYSASRMQRQINLLLGDEAGPLPKFIETVGDSKKMVFFSGGAGSAGIDQVQPILADLEGLRATLVKAGPMLDNGVEVLTTINTLINEQPKDGPGSVELVDQLKAKWMEGVQLLQTADNLVKALAQDVVNSCKSASKKITAWIKATVIHAVARRNVKGLTEVIDWMTSLANGGVGLVQALDGEPLSGAALEGVHALIKGIHDGAKEIAIGIEASKLEFDEALAEMKPTDVEADRLAYVNLAISWLVEPLGFVPSVGSMIREFLLKQVETLIEARLEAMEKEEKVDQTVLDAVESEFVNTVRSESPKWVAESAKAVGEAIKDGAKTPSELIALVVESITGPILKKILAQLIEGGEPVTKEEVTKVLGALDLKSFFILDDSEVPFNRPAGFVQDEAHKVSKAHLKTLAQGQSDVVYLAYSQSFVDTDGVALLLGGEGAGHSADNVLFMISLINAGQGYEGTVQLTKKGSTGSRGEVTFGHWKAGGGPSPTQSAEDLVERYFKKYGQHNPLTQKTLIFDEEYEL